MNRRSFLAAAGATLASVGLSGCRSAHPPLRGVHLDDELHRDLPVLGLATSFAEEISTPAKVEGTLPSELAGTLFRNGPGLFERAGRRKRCLLDGDGMIHAWRFADGSVDFCNRYVRTEKYKAEEEAGKFLFPTWSTQAPGGPLANLFPTLANQAGVSVIAHQGRLYAFDEYQPPYELDPVSLETIGIAWLGQPKGAAVFSAHSKLDRRTGEWIFFTLDHGPRSQLFLTVLEPDGQRRNRQVFTMPGSFYIHDFFATARHLVVHLHPAQISPLPILFGLKSVTGAMRWRPERGSLVLVFERDGDQPPRRFEAEASWMWHSLNAWEEAGTIRADFVGYRNPDHFLGRDPAHFAIMEGRWGDYNCPGELRRFVIDLPGNRLRQEVLAGENHEFPAVNPHHVCYRHRFGYLLRISPAALFFDEVVRVDFDSGRTESYRFSPGIFCTEPVFAPLPGHVYQPGGEEPGWLLSECYDGNRRRAFLAIFRADAVADGPVATAWLDHHVPLGFHGFWQPA